MVSLIVSALSLFATVSAHLQLNYPPSFNASNNPHTTGNPDPFLFYPYNCCGRTTPFPCRGYLDLLGTPAGAPVVSWAAGSKQDFSLTGMGNHYGGSCQVGFSIDKGKTFQVATSFEGDCPHRNGGVNPAGQTFAFKVPADMPAGEAVFAWTWMNREQEFFMDCAAVTITKGGSSLSSSSGSSSGGSKKGTDSALSAATASNAAPAYYMDDSCSCICASPFKVDKDDQYVTGGCTCTCDKLPSTAKPEMIHKHETASQPVAKRMTTAIAMGGAECSCTCAQAAHKESNGEYSMEDCTCTCSKNPASATKKIKTKRFGSFAHGLSDAHFHRLIAKGNVERDVEIIHNEFDDRSVAYENRPSMFFADINDGCESPHTTAELKYPNPGPNVVPGDGAYPLALPSGNCGN